MAKVETVRSLPAFAPYVPVALPLRGLSMAHAAWVTFITDNPLTWWWCQGRRNPQADMEGPLYIYAAPNRQLEDGKAVLATVEELKEYAPFLMSLTILAPDGKPVPNARIEWWQATPAGVYAYSSYSLRGTFTTDAQGRIEILTVTPGAYGPLQYLRAGHFHMIIDGGSQYERLTTQLYVCPANDKQGMMKDFLNYMRAPRFGNLLQVWSIPTASGGKTDMNFPQLARDPETEKRVEWWNAKMAERSTDKLEVIAGAETKIVLNKRPGWFGF
ncbi:hypothetical protein NM688_g1990 [Phlebia brevispora]|uniref:Uncharacterized protein n=1 Tax=Phlebia brevispora TaxID=194682 RepID=A0ACC1TA75_9APHY|nr:hypothetical protein NM688_g1990 [Phlebia brevispora]